MLKLGQIVFFFKTLAFKKKVKIRVVRPESEIFGWSRS